MNRGANPGCAWRWTSRIAGTHFLCSKDFKGRYFGEAEVGCIMDGKREGGHSECPRRKLMWTCPAESQPASRLSWGTWKTDSRNCVFARVQKQILWWGNRGTVGLEGSEIGSHGT